MESNTPGSKEELLYKALLPDLRSICTDPVEIEILPPSIQVPEGQFVLKDENCLGILKKALVGAFLHAKSIFTAGMKNATSEVRLSAKTLPD
jgi:hypothetical protein